MLQIGIIGTGGITKLHLKCFEKIEGVKVAAFCNPHIEKAQALAKEYGGNAYTECRDMLDHEKLDAVYVCVPPFAHDGQELLIAERGIPMFVEKPIGLDPDYVNQVCERVKTAKLLTSVGYSFKYTEAFEKLREVLQGHRVVMARGCWSNSMPGVYWWKKRDLSGGQIVEQSTHVFDMMRTLFGEVALLQGVGNSGAIRDRSDYDIEDSSSVNLLFRNGIVGNVCSIAFAGPKHNYCHIEVTCSDDLFCRISLSDNKLLICDNEGIREIQCVGHDAAFVKENQIFLDAIRSGDSSKIRSTYDDARKTLELTFAAMDSLTNGGCTVTL